MSDTSSWDKLLKEEKEKDYYKSILKKLEEDSKHNIVCPKKEDIFNAFKITKFEEIKVVILGQDPYHGEGQAHGLAFSVPDGIKKPPSLVNIFKEINSDLKLEIPKSGNLEYLAKQGVFLLNTSLSVIKDSPASHSKIGWDIFTDKVIELISTNKEKIVFMLWGTHAISKKHLISDKHLVLTAPHPSPLSAHRGFLGCKHFSKANSYLSYPINWV